MRAVFTAGSTLPGAGMGQGQGQQQQCVPGGQRAALLGTALILLQP